jgi:uncharacterized protein YeaO (DUF488 family)
VIVLKRAYESASPRDGRRFLVERLWPRGVTKQKRRVDAWLKDAAPTTELRTWFAHGPEKGIEFRKRYRRELDAAPEAWAPILAAGGRGRVTLVYSSHDTEHNNAVVLREYVGARLRRTARARRRRLS